MTMPRDRHESCAQHRCVAAQLPALVIGLTPRRQARRGQHAHRLPTGGLQRRRADEQPSLSPAGCRWGRARAIPAAAAASAAPSGTSRLPTQTTVPSGVCSTTQACCGTRYHLHSAAVRQPCCRKGIACWFLPFEQLGAGLGPAESSPALAAPAKAATRATAATLAYETLGSDWGSLGGAGIAEAMQRPRRK